MEQELSDLPVVPIRKPLGEYVIKVKHISKSMDFLESKNNHQYLIS